MKNKNEQQNLMEGLLSELNRVREVKAMYDAIPQGKFGSMMIQQDIDRAEKAIKDNDVIEMVKAYKKLQGVE